jgi:hypothetical protein
MGMSISKIKPTSMNEVVHYENATCYVLNVITVEDDGEFSKHFYFMLQHTNTWMTVLYHHGVPHYTYVSEKLRVNSTDAKSIVKAISEFFQYVNRGEK